MPMRELHGLRAGTPDNLVFGPGKGYIGADLSKLLAPAELDPVTAALRYARPIGATRGGYAFAVEPEMRTIELDGMRGPQKGLQRKDSETATLTVNFAEITVANLLRMIPGATRTVVGNGLTHVTGGELVQESYISNLLFTGTHGVGGRDFPAVLVIENALATEGFEIGLEDKDEGIIECTFTAHYDTATADTAPWHIFIATDEPIVTGITPASGAVGLSRTAAGSNLSMVTGVLVGSNPGVIGSGRTDASLPFTAPAGTAAGNYPVALLYPDGVMQVGSITIV